MLDNSHINILMEISRTLKRDNIGDALVRAVMINSIILDPKAKVNANSIMDRIRSFARGADIGWKVFQEPIKPDISLTELQTLQIMAIIGTLLELNYSFERIEEASLFTFENSAPVRFYINSIFHYITALFLLDKQENTKQGFAYPGTIIKVLQPIGLVDLLHPVYKILNRPFGKEKNYGDTILAVRNKSFVHGNFSPENIRRVAKDSNIFSEEQKFRFINNHWDIFDRLIVLRLQLISILSYLNINSDKFASSNLFHL